MTDTGGTELDATPSVLVVHTAVRYHRCQGLGIGLIQRVACAKTDRTKSDILETHKQGLKVGREEFAASKKNPHIRADMVALLQALHLAKATVKKRWPQTTVLTTVVVLLGRPCKEVMEIIKHHIEHGPESYKSLQDPHRSTVKQIIKRIHQIRGAGIKISVQMSDHHDSVVQVAAAHEAERRFKRACHDVRKLAVQKTADNALARTTKGAGDKDTSFELPIREHHAVHETREK